MHHDQRKRKKKRRKRRRRRKKTTTHFVSQNQERTIQSRPPHPQVASCFSSLVQKCNNANRHGYRRPIFPLLGWVPLVVVLFRRRLLRGAFHRRCCPIRRIFWFSWWRYQPQDCHRPKPPLFEPPLSVAATVLTRAGLPGTSWCMVRPLAAAAVVVSWLLWGRLLDR